MGISLCLTVISIVRLPIYFINGVIAEVPSSSAKVISSSIDATSTRSYHYFTIKEGKEAQNDSQGAYTYAKNLPITQNRTICPQKNETAIFIHGEWAEKKSAIEQFNRIAMSIKTNNYEIYLVGFIWDSNSAISRDGWQTAKIAAEKNGLELAQFILDFKTRCKVTKIRLIAHSLGANVVNSTLVALNNNEKWHNNGFKITSVYLLGAAINNNAIARNTTLGKAIEKVVDDFYNLYDPEDKMLEYVYSHIENHSAALLNDYCR